MANFGTRLRALRLQNHMTQEHLARQLGVTKSVVSAYETGLRMPSYEVLIQIARIYHVTTDYLLGLEQESHIDLSGLTSQEADAVMSLISAMKRV
ncbi:MAG: helix-turn-helix transcriptional regulator [Eubacteriales bacterium]|nr:helix-turn-helix transcriptional regulator [Eubacteriales bacterium]